MNRRQFLQALAALGASIWIPVALEAASDAQIDDAWSKLIEDPWYFEVNDYGTLVESGVAEPRVRGDVFFIDERPATPEDLIRAIDSCDPLRHEFQRRAADHIEVLGMHADELEDGWQAWVSYEGQAGMEKSYTIIDRWLDSPIDWDEMDWFPRDWSGQGRAFNFFAQMDPMIRDELGIRIVEGDHPGSDYFAAELGNDIDEANRAAERLGLPFRFRPEA